MRAMKSAAVLVSLASLLIASACGHDESVSERSFAGQTLSPEQEPNSGIATATPLAGDNVVVTGMIHPDLDVDYYSFSGEAGDRVYAATQTGFSADGDNSVLTLLRADGTTVVEEDTHNGSFGPLASSIAGALLPATETYYLRVRAATAGAQLRPYQLHVQLRSGTPESEAEPNNAMPQPLAGGWIAGDLSATADVDLYSIDLDAGETAYVSLDLDPERNGVEWNGSLSFSPAAGAFVVANDGGSVIDALPDSEAAFFTALDAGTYILRVSAPSTSFGTYHLNASVHAAASETGCVTHTNDGDLAIGPGVVGPVASVIPVPDDMIIGDVDVSIRLSHASPDHLDVVLLSPAGTHMGLVTDVGSDAFPTWDVRLNDEAAIPVTSTGGVVNGMELQPERNYRLHWLDGQQAQGNWSLQLWDDTAGDGGTLDSWSVTICPAPPTCPLGTGPRPIYSADFELDDGGFTHFGTADEWARGTPSAAPIDSCGGGASCFKTDLTGDVDPDSDQTLLSPPVSLAGVTDPIRVRWSQQYQFESGEFDRGTAVVRLRLRGRCSSTSTGS
jgi:subtilisin-like proprotein convertase family protein